MVVEASAWDYMRYAHGFERRTSVTAGINFFLTEWAVNGKRLTPIEDRSVVSRARLTYM